MQIKVNQEIRDIKDEFLSGLSVRQTIWSAAALCAGRYHFLECVCAFRQYRYGIVPYVMRKCAVGLDRLF